MSQNWVKDIQELHKKFGVNDAVSNFTDEQKLAFLKHRVNFVEEEFTELKTATNADDFVDACIDLCVIAIGNLDAYNVDPYLAWDRVLAANMAKYPGVNPKRPNKLGVPDMIKPEGWQSPSHADNVGLIEQVQLPLNFE